MIRVPLYLEVAQWALLLGLGLLLVVVYRQLGRLLTRDGRPAELGPPVGSKASRLGYALIAGGAAASFAPGDGQPALLAFVDPTCPACEKLVTALGGAQDAGELAGVRVLLLVSDPPGYLQISEAFSSTRLDIAQLVDRAGLAAYRASATPLLVAVDGAGVVRAAGAAVGRAEVRAFSLACLPPPPGASLAVAAPGRSRADGRPQGRSRADEENRGER